MRLLLDRDIFPGCFTGGARRPAKGPTCFCFTALVAENTRSLRQNTCWRNAQSAVVYNSNVPDTAYVANAATGFARDRVTRKLSSQTQKEIEGDERAAWEEDLYGTHTGGFASAMDSPFTSSQTIRKR